MADLTDPETILRPSAWPEPRLGRLWILPLDIASAEPGLITPYFANICQSRQHAWVINKKYFARNIISDSTLRARALWHLGDKPTLVGDPSEAATLQELFGLSEVPTMLEVPHRAATLSNWAQAISPGFSKAFPDSGRVLFKRSSGLSTWLRHYEREFPQASEFPWQGLRFFAGFLRRQNVIEAAQLFETDWAKFSSLFSPQDENSERESLMPGELMLNPTAQTVRRQLNGSPQVEIFVRVERSVRSIYIRPIDAAILDEVQERARVNRIELLAILEHEYGAVFGSTAESANFAAAIDELTVQSILLG